MNVGCGVKVRVAFGDGIKVTVEVATDGIAIIPCRFHTDREYHKQPPLHDIPQMEPGSHPQSDNSMI